MAEHVVQTRVAVIVASARETRSVGPMGSVTSTTAAILRWLVAVMRASSTFATTGNWAAWIVASMVVVGGLAKTTELAATSVV